MGNLRPHDIKKAQPGTRLTDGDGLRLDIDRKGRGYWFLRYTSPSSGKERLMSIGPLKAVGLAEARDRAADARSDIRKRIDPLDIKRKERAAALVDARKAVTFATYAETYISTHEAAWKNVNHRRNWRNSLIFYANPLIGQTAVADIDTDAVLSVLRPIWQEKHETARNVRQRMEVVLAAAKVEGLREGQNPAVWRGHLDHLLPRLKRMKVHFAALPYGEMPDFSRSLAADKSAAAALLKFTIATVARYSESANAIWSEIDIERRLWTIPGSRMKTGRDHQVPLNDAALAALKASTTEAGLVFPNAKSGKPMSDVALAKCIKRHTDVPATTHGMRSCFRDWAGDCTDYPRELAEAALAHSIGNAVEQAYRRGNALEKRRLLMDEWASFITHLYAI